MSAEKNPHEFEVLLSQLVSMVPFYFSGKKIFSYEKGLTEMLFHTDLYNVDASLIQLPYDCLYIIVPPNCLFKTDADTGEPLEVEGIYVSKGYEMSNGFIHSKKPILSLNIISNSPPDYEGEAFTDIRYMGLPYRENENIFPHLKSFMESDPEEDEESVGRLFSFVINAILYINSDKAVIERIKPYDKKHRDKVVGNKKTPTTSSISRYVVGKNIYLNSRNKAGNGAKINNTSSNGEESTYYHQWIVRGHWRNQACGPYLSERKLIWIQPYVKGEGIIVNKKYVVK